jgi:hypothetical protein
MSLTPSAGPRVERCLGSAVLPQADEEHEGTERGRALHGFMTALALGRTRAHALASVSEDWREDAGRIEVPEDITSGRPEVGLALDVNAGTARALGEDMTREQVRAARRSDETGMLLDWVAIQDTTGVVRDWKFGWQEDLGPASEHLQVLVYGASTLLAWALEAVRCELWHWDGVRWRVDAVTLDFVAALEVLDRWKRLLGRASEARTAYEARGVLPRLSVGKWCAWCPAQRRCPAQVASALAVLQQGDPASTAVEMAPEQAGEAWERLRVLESWARARREDIERIAGMTPLPLADGKVLRAQDVERTSPIPEKGAEWLARRFGPEVAAAAAETKVTMSWGGALDAIRQHVIPEMKRAHEEKRGPKPSLAALEREMRMALAAMDGVKVSRFTQVKPMAPELPAAAEPPEDVGANG